MKSKLTIPWRRFLSLLQGIVGAGLLAAIPIPCSAAEPAPDKATAKFEIRFLKDMIDHHNMAVEMAVICEGKAVRAELEAQCGEMRTGQSEEIELMQGWLADWYGIEYEPRMGLRDMEMLEMLAMLDGAEFEIEFLEMMIKHHGTAIKSSGKCTRRAAHNALRQLCHDIIEAQRAEIELMRDWLCDWHGVCRGRRHHSHR